MALKDVNILILEICEYDYPYGKEDLKLKI